VEDDSRLVALEDLAHLGAALAVGQDRDGRREAALVDQLALDLEQGRLALVDQHQPLRPEPRDLAAELRADRSSGPGDEHRLLAQVGGRRLEIDLDRLAAEHVLDLHRPDLRGELALARDQLVEPGQRLDGHVPLARGSDDPLARLARGGRERDQHLVRLVVAQDVRQVLGCAEHAHAVDTEVLLAVVIVDQADRRVAELSVALQLADHELAGVAGADDQYLLAPRDEAGPWPLDHRPREKARSRDQAEQQQPVHDRDRAGQPHLADRREEVDRQPGDQRGDGHAAERAPHVAHRDVAPPAVVEAAQHEDDELDRDDDQDRAPEERVVVRRHAAVEAELEGEVPRERDQARVGDQLPDPVAVDADHARTAAASRIVATTRSCVSAGMPAHIGRARFSRAARSVSGSEPSFQPR